MTSLRLTLETRRAAFRAQVVATASGESEVSTRRMAAAILATDAEVVTAVETSLAERGESFGSRAHIDSLHPLPLSEDMKRAFARLPATRAATPADLLLAVFRSDEGLARTLAPLRVGDDEAVRLDEADLPALRDLCLRSTAFFELVEGQPASDGTAAEILAPPAPEYTHGVQHVWGIRSGGELIAVAELLQGHPGVQDWYIGLLLVDPGHRRKGLGAQFCAGILDWIRSLGGSTVRLVVQQQNPEARAFWERQGFAIERETVTIVGQRESVVWILARRV